MEIAPKIHLVPPYLPSATIGAPAPPNVYLVLDQGHGFFIDSGHNNPEEVRERLVYWEWIGRPAITRLAITHFHAEHAGGAQGFKEAMGAPVTVHPAEREATDALFERPVVDSVFEDGEILPVGDSQVQVVHTPGHTPGNCCYLLLGEGVLFTGDHIMGEGTVVVRPAEGGDMAQHIASLRKLLDYDVKVIAPGHGPLIHDPQTRIRGLIEHRLQREEQVLDLLRRGTGDVDRMVQALYSNLQPRRLRMARLQVLAHLKKLQQEVRAEAVEEDRVYRLR